MYINYEIWEYESIYFYFVGLFSFGSKMGMDYTWIRMYVYGLIFILRIQFLLCLVKNIMMGVLISLGLFQLLPMGLMFLFVLIFSMCLNAWIIVERLLCLNKSIKYMLTLLKIIIYMWICLHFKFSAILLYSCIFLLLL